MADGLDVCVRDGVPVRGRHRQRSGGADLATFAGTLDDAADRLDHLVDLGVNCVYFYNDWRAEKAWGATRPDYGRDEVHQFLIDNALMIAEDLQQNPMVTLATAEGGLGFDLQWAAGFVHPVCAVLETTVDEERDLHAVAAAMLSDRVLHPGGVRRVARGGERSNTHHRRSQRKRPRFVGSDSPGCASRRSRRR